MRPQYVLDVVVYEGFFDCLWDTPRHCGDKSLGGRGTLVLRCDPWFDGGWFWPSSTSIAVTLSLSSWYYIRCLRLLVCRLRFHALEPRYCQHLCCFQSLRGALKFWVIQAVYHRVYLPVKATVVLGVTRRDLALIWKKQKERKEERNGS